MQIKSSLKRLKSTLLVACIVCFASLGGLYMFEVFVAKTDPQAKDFWWLYPQKPLPISWHSLATHLTPTFRAVHPGLNYEGPAPWETRGRVDEARVFHIRSNRYGFYTDFPVDQYPKKEAKEFRIILVGGSGAQGHGGSSNEHMMYHVLQEKLQHSLRDTGFKIRVINLAVGSHEARLNSGVLRAFGHAVKPDMILAYNGANDIAQFPNNYYADTCTPYYEDLMKSTYVQPDWMRNAGEYFPALFYRYGLVEYIKRSFYGDRYKKQATETCLRDLNVDTSKGRLMTALYRDGAAPMFVEHFKAIKRDFCGIPIMFALQAIHAGERKLYDMWLTDFNPQTNPIAILNGITPQEASVTLYNPEKRIVHFIVRASNAAKPSWEDAVQSGTGYDQVDGTIVIKHNLGALKPMLYYALEKAPADQTSGVYTAYQEDALNQFRRQNGVYQQFYRDSAAALKQYMNPYWYFVNVDKIANDIDPASVPDMKSTSIAVHLDDVGQVAVAGIIHDSLQPVVRKLIHDTQKPACRENTP